MVSHSKGSRDRLLVRADGECCDHAHHHGMARRGGGGLRLRGVALALVLLSVSLMGYTAVLLGRPLYWKIYAEVVHRYESDAAAQLIRELQEQKGQQHLVAEGIGGRKALPGGLPDASEAAAPHQQQPAPAAGADPAAPPPGDGGGGGPAAAPASSPDAAAAQTISSLVAAAAAAGISPEELEKQRARAREKQWEDEWWEQYQKYEKERKARLAKEHAEREASLIKAFNHTLSKDLVKSLAQDGYLVITWANHHYTDFALSWVYHVQRVGITGYMVGAMDDEILVALARRKIHTFNMAAGLTMGDFGWGSKTFAKMGRKKISLIAQFLELGIKVVISDVDVLWLRNPLPFFSRFPGADILTSSDHLTTTAGSSEALEKYPDSGSAFNIGIMVFREKSLPFVKEWIDVIEADDTIWDQNAFNDLIRAGQVIQEDDPNHYFLGDQGKLSVGVLPVALFCSGHVYFTQRLHKTLGVEPYAVHATFQFSGTPGKRHRFRDAGLWLEDDKYYHPPNGFVTYTPSIPKELLDRAGPRTGAMDLENTVGHFDLVNYQLRQLRQALAVATVLGRTLILPEIWCGLDRYWAPHAGTLPGSTFKLPFVCPADHVLDLENGWARPMDKNEFGPDIGYRESSFLNNPTLPDVVRSSVVHISPCKRGSVGCATGDNPATLEFNRLFVAESVDSDHLAMALSSVSSISVLNFTSIDSAFSDFSRPEDSARFFKRLQHYGAVWCCVDAHPGHVHYDFWWDVPHRDRFDRAWNGTWRPITGP